MTVLHASSRRSMSKPLLFALASLALPLLACSNDAERVIRSWEKLALLMSEKHEDCAEFAAELEQFREANADVFSTDMRPVYQQIQADLELRVRFERTLAELDAQSFQCRDDNAVQAASRRLFEPLIRID